MSIFFQNILQAIRSLRTQAWQVAISAVSIAVGITCLTFSSNWLWSETHYDTFRQDYDDLYLLGQTDTMPLAVADFYSDAYVNSQDKEELRLALEGTGVEMGHYLPRNINNVEALHAPDNPFNVRHAETMGVDSAFVSVLRIPVLHGNVADALSRPDGIVLTDSLAMRLFGEVDVVGKTVCRTNTSQILTVGAVVEANKGNTHFSYDCLVGITTRFDMKGTPASLRLHFNVVMRIPDVEECNRRLAGLRSRHFIDEDRLYYYVLYPLQRPPHLGLHDSVDLYVEHFLYPLVFVLISLLLVISALANLIMVYTSINLNRVREYALRRSMGATAWQNVQWILTGVMPTLLIAVLFAGVCMEWTRYAMGKSAWNDGDLNFFYVVIVSVVVLLCLLGMAFPIWRMRKAYRESFLGHGGTVGSHSWLITVQCVVSAILLFVSIAMQRQMYTVLNADLGYEHENMLRLFTADHSTTNGRRDNLKLHHTFKFTDIIGDLTQELARESAAGITDVIALHNDICTPASCRIFEELTVVGYPDKGVELTDKDAVVLKGFSAITLPYRALEFFNIKPVNGGGFPDVTQATDEPQLLVSPDVMKRYMPKEELPLRIRVGHSGPESYNNMGGNRIIYVNFGGHEEVWNIRGAVDVKPFSQMQGNDRVLIFGVPEERYKVKGEHEAVYIKYEPGRREDAEKAVRRVLRQFDVPDNDIFITPVDEYISDAYKTDKQYADILALLSIVSLLITLAGVFSMLLYSLRLRRRSMAIHRVMGATFRDIFVSTIRPYAIYAVIGAVIAYFPALLLVEQWAFMFSDDMEMPGVGLMLAILASMLGIIALIVWWQVSLCMKDKPVEILKPEA